MLANAGLSAAYDFFVILGILGFVILLLLVGSASVLSRKRRDRSGVVRALAAADLIAGIAGLALCVPLLLLPVLAVPLGVGSVGLLLAGWKLFRNARSLELEERTDTSTEDGFWKQFE